MSVSGAGGTDWRKELLQLEMAWIGSAQNKIEDEIKSYTDKTTTNKGGAGQAALETKNPKNDDGTSGMDQKQSLQLQYDIGNYTSIVNATSNIEKTLKDALAATVRNFS